MEVHHQHKYAPIDSSASSHFYPNINKGAQHYSTADPIRVGCPYKAVMVSLIEDIIYFNKLPLGAKNVTN